MRRVLYIIGVMVAIFATSCSDDMVTIEGGEAQSYVDINISTQLGSSYTTDGGAASVSTTRGDFAGVSDNDYKMRYTVELWDSEGSTVLYHKAVVVDDIDAPLTHSLRAVVGEYKLVIFADYIRSSDRSSHYDTSSLDNITINNVSYSGSDTSRDSYGYCGDLVVTSAFTLNGVELKRLMAKMTLASQNSVSSGSTIAITYNPSISSGYNLLKGEVVANNTITPSYSSPNTNIAGGEIIAYDYIFVDATPASYKMGIMVGSDTRTSTIRFEQNKITNITSDFASN